MELQTKIVIGNLISTRLLKRELIDTTLCDKQYRLPTAFGVVVNIVRACEYPLLH